MRKSLLLIAVAVMVTFAAACGGSGMPDPDNTMGPGNMGDDMRVAAVDTTASSI